MKQHIKDVLLGLVGSVHELPEYNYIVHKSLTEVLVLV